MKDKIGLGQLSHPHIPVLKDWKSRPREIPKIWSNFQAVWANNKCINWIFIFI